NGPGTLLRPYLRPRIAAARAVGIRGSRGQWGRDPRFHRCGADSWDSVAGLLPSESVRKTAGRGAQAICARWGVEVDPGTLGASESASGQVAAVRAGRRR